MQKFAFICLIFVIAFSSPANAIFGYGNSGPSAMINLAKQIQSSMNNNNNNNNAPKTSAGAPQAAPKLSDVVNKVFETLRKQEEGTNEAPQTVTPAPQEVPQNTSATAPTTPVVKQNTTNTTNVTQETPKPVKLNSPSPQCLSVTYQALSILYSFGADAGSQDVDQLQTDYTNLNPVIQGINNFCNPKIVNVPSESRVTYQDCSVSLNAMNDAVNTFQSGDPTNYMNVIQTIQEIWNLKDNFTTDCASLINKKNQQPVIVKKPVVQAEPKTCESFYTQAFFKLFKISEDANVNDLAEILKGFNSLRSIILNINQYCPSNLHVNMFSKERSTKGVCSEHFVEMRKIVTTSRVSELKDLSNTLQKVWNMTPLFLHDC